MLDPQQPIRYVLNRDINSSVTTHETFERVANNHPWRPFRHKINNPVDVEERRLFAELSGKYERHATVSDPQHCYNAFYNEWEAECGRRYLQAVSGDEHVIVIYRKSVPFLQQYFDELEVLRRAATLQNPTSAAQHKVMQHELRATRAGPTIPSVQLQPLKYPTRDPGTIPTGDPLVLQPDVALAGMKRKASEHGSSPFVVPATAFPSRTMRELPSPLSFRQICRKCGRHSSEHPDRGSFGTGCPFKCCGRCSLSETEHNKRSMQMGFHCQLTNAHGVQVLTGSIESYEKKIAAFAQSSAKK
jgi:hypothetical protein